AGHHRRSGDPARDRRRPRRAPPCAEVTSAPVPAGPRCEGHAAMFRILPDGERFAEYVLLRQGESVLLRTATPADVPAVESFHGGGAGAGHRRGLIGGRGEG